MSCLTCATAHDVAELCASVVTDADIGMAGTRATATGELTLPADAAARDAAMEVLRERWPDDAVVVEGAVPSPGRSGRVWIVDPLDGTANRASGSDHWAAAVACCDSDGAVAAAVVSPMLRMAACSTCGTVDAPAAAVPSSDVALLGVPSPQRRNVAAADRLAALADVLPEVRILGACAVDLALVVAGRAALYLEEQLALWDWAASAVVARATGIHVVAWQQGERWAVFAHGGHTPEAMTAILEELGTPTDVHSALVSVARTLVESPS